MIYLSLFFEFFKIGLFAIGGGLATLPFLLNLSEKTGWFTEQQLVQMIAVSESTPGPVGVNMATFVGVQSAGVFGGLIATVALVLPALFIIIFISRYWDVYRKNKFIDVAFSGLRPAVAGLILSFILLLCKAAVSNLLQNDKLVVGLILMACYLFLYLKYKKHPIVYIVLGGVMGFICGL